MPLADIGKVCLFSGISGVITYEGQAVKHARIERVVGRAFSRSKLTDETTTDEKGYFDMPPVFERTVAKYLPQEFSVPQQVFVYHDGARYEIWSASKANKEENTEGRGKPLDVVCQLDQEMKHIVVEGNWISSRCTWDVEADPDDTGF